jgi:glycosyltransferase involved in cell wall biosynthesis
MDINFVFVGKCVDYQGYLGINWLERIKTNAQEFSDRVIHINPLPHSQLYPIIKKSYFVVLPSREDNFPNTCLEAMAHKKLVIGTRGTSLEQMINHEENGLLFDKDNADDLLNTINEALNLPPERLEEIGEKAAQRIERLSPKYITMQMLEFYQNTIDNFSNLSNR